MITFIGINNGCSKFLRLNEKAEFYIRARKDDFSDWHR